MNLCKKSSLEKRTRWNYRLEMCNNIVPLIDVEIYICFAVLATSASAVNALFC